MKYIIEYLPGTKGDLLTKVCNGTLEWQMEQYNRSPHDSFSNFKNLNLQNENVAVLPSENLFNEICEKFNLTTNKYTNCHYSKFFHLDAYQKILEKHDIKVIKLIFSRKFYQTVKIEDFIKNLEFKKHDPSLFLLEQKHRIEHLLELKGLLPTDENRIQCFDEYLKQIKLFKFYEYYNHFHNDYKIMWNYEDLYVKFNLDFLDLTAVSMYKNLVEKSWLPNQIEVYSKVWNLGEYGYRNFE